MQIKPKAVIFDLFGTIVRYRIQRHPYRQLLKWAREQGRKPQPNDARTIMTTNAEIGQLAAHMEIPAPNSLIKKLTDDIEMELQSLELFDDVEPTLDALQNKNIQLAICSNLAKPYGAAISQLLAGYSFTKILSFECGFIKPEPSIYKFAATEMNVDAANCLFVGDTLLADVQGPCNAGMQALHLVRNEERPPTLKRNSL